MKSVFRLTVLLAMTLPTVLAAQSIQEEVRAHLNWCANDWGVNEGAQEAIRYINAAVSAGYPNQVSAVIGFANEIPGVAQNTLKRPPVIDAARSLVHVNQDLAIDLALTCQAHNGGVRQFLNANRNLVATWLRGQL